MTPPAPSPVASRAASSVAEATGSAASAAARASGRPGSAGGTGEAGGARGAAGSRLRPAASGLPPKPDGGGEAAWVRALTAIDPDIDPDEADEADARGRYRCPTIRGFPHDRDRRIAAAVRRFVSPGRPQGFGTPRGARVVDAVHANLCPGF